MRGRVVRHIYAIVLGVLIQLYMYGAEIFHVVFLTYGAYILMGVVKREKQQMYVTAWVFAYLSYNHYDSYINRFMVYDMGVTTFTMLHVLKL